jgi:hypothetical protein
MRKRVLVAGVALISMAVPGPGLAAGVRSHFRSKVPRATVSLVTRAFAAHGIPLEQKGRPWPIDDKSLALKVLWNRKDAPSQGEITVQVLRSAAELKSLPAHQRKANVCAGFPTSYLIVKSRNVVATYTSCVTLSSPMHLATQPAVSGFVAAMYSLR